MTHENHQVDCLQMYHVFHVSEIVFNCKRMFRKPNAELMCQCCRPPKWANDWAQFNQSDD